MTRVRGRHMAFLVASGLIVIASLAPVRASTAAEGSTSAGAAVAPFQPAVVLDGTPRERGADYGARFGGAIRAFLDAEIYQPFAGKPASKQQMLRYAADCGRVVREVCPMVGEEYEGIARGAGVSFDEVILINLHEELYHRGDLPKSGHCTAVALGPPVTADERTFVGQTWDWMTSVAGKSAVTEWRRGGRPGDGASVLAYGFPGMPAGAGLSSAGIALCWTSAALGEKGQTPRVGIPSYVLIAHLLSQKDMDSVVREAERDRHAGWFTFVLADGQGNLVNIEGSPQGVVVERSRGSLARVGYGSRRMTGTADAATPPLHGRCATFQGLIAESQGKLDVVMLKHVLADPGKGISVGEATIDLMVYDTTARRAYLSRGASYGVEWREFGFRDHVQGAGK